MKLTDLDDANAGRAVKGPDCDIGLLWDNSDEADRAVLRRWLTGNTREYSGAWIARQLQALGYSISQTTIQRHRRRECIACPRRGRDLYG